MIYAFALILVAALIAVGLYVKLHDHAGEPPGVAPPKPVKKPNEDSGNDDQTPGKPRK